METTVKQRLISFIEHLAISKNAFEKNCGLSLRAVSNIKSTISDDTLKKIVLRYPELNPTWVMLGEGPMLRDSTPRVMQNNVNGDNNYISGNNNRIHSDVGDSYDAITSQPQREFAPTPASSSNAIYPVVPTEIIKAPDINIADWLEENFDQCKKIDLHKLIGKISHVQPMTSRAMEPRIPEGALLFMREVNSWDEALLDGSVYGVDVNKPHMIVRKVYDEGEFIRCEPINPEFGAVRVPKNKVMNLYKIRVGLKLFE